MPARAACRSDQTAFTLFELMAILAITGIVGALAISAYRTYSVRTEVADGLLLAARAKAPIEAAFNRDGEPPADGSAAGLPADPSEIQSQFVQSFGIANGRIDLAFGNAAHRAVAGRRLR